MPISLICPGCQRQMTAPDAAGGRNVKCPACGVLFTVPPATAVLVQPPPLPPPIRSERPATFSLEDSDEDIIERPEPRRRRRQYADSFDAGPRSASCGIASLVISIVAFVSCWLPGVGIYIAGLGFILAICSFARRESAGFAIAGFFMSLLAAVPTLIVFLALSSPRDVAVRPAAPAAPAPINVVMAPEKTPEAVLPEMGEFVDSGFARVTVVGARIGTIGLKDLGRRSDSVDRLLKIDVLVGNTSDTAILPYIGWGARGIGFSEPAPILVDEFGNNYPRSHFGFGVTVVGQTTFKDIYPRNAHSDALVFSAPVDRAKRLRLELDASNIGGSGKIRFIIPVERIENQ